MTQTELPPYAIVHAVEINGYRRERELSRGVTEPPQFASGVGRRQWF